MKSGYFAILIFLVIHGSIFAQSVTFNKVAFSSNEQQVETSIAINPTNKLNLIGAAIIPSGTEAGCAAYYSLDGGKHMVWK